MRIERALKSKLPNVDMENLSFGTVFSDHMFFCKYQNGSWLDPKIIPYQSISFDPSTSVFHYGQAVFEGMKAYKDVKNKIWLFVHMKTLTESISLQRDFKSQNFLKSFFNGLHELLKIDAEWIQPGVGNSLYIRPFVFASQAGVQASPSLEYTFLIICCPVKSYYGGEVNLLIEEDFSRAAEGGVGFAKTAGNYAAQFYPTALAQKKGYQQIIWTDAKSHNYLEESGTMNIFFKINDKLITAPTNDRILDGITRKSVIQIANDLGIDVEIRPVKVSEIIEAAENKSLKEVFGSGTAVVVSSIKSFGYRGKNYKLPKVVNPLAANLKEKNNSNSV